jgi:hypothetical protein
MSSYGHDAVFGDLPAGKGTLSIDGNDVVFEGKAFLSTTRGRDTFEVLKEMGPDQEWSFGFRILGAEVPDDSWKKKGARRMLTKLDAFEVSPVIRGAGVNTRTLAVKAEEVLPDPAIEAARVEAESKAAEDAETATPRGRAKGQGTRARERGHRPPVRSENSLSEFPLHCEKCVRDLGETSSEPVQLVALFKPSKFGRMAKTHPAERRHRCLHCGFVNVFHPAEASLPERQRSQPPLLGGV